MIPKSLAENFSTKKVGRPKKIRPPIDNSKSRSRFRQRVLEFIRAYIRIYGVSPPYSVMAKGLGLAGKGNMHRIVGRLEKEGFLIIRRNERYNGIRVVDRDSVWMRSK